MSKVKDGAMSGMGIRGRPNSCPCFCLDLGGSPMALICRNHSSLHRNSKLLSQRAHLKAEMLAGKKSTFITVEIRAGPYARVVIFILNKGEHFILYNSKLLGLYCYFNKNSERRKSEVFENS